MPKKMSIKKAAGTKAKPTQPAMSPKEMFALVKRDDVQPSVGMTRAGEIQFQNDKAMQKVKKSLLSFIEMAGTASGQSTYYDSKAGQQKAVIQLHDSLLDANRGLYAAMLTFPGVNDVHKQLGIMRLVGSGIGKGECSLMTPEQENRLVGFLIESLPIHRLLKLFGHMRDNRVNNSRARKIILTTVLNGGSLEFWSVKYRHKMRTALVHALGRGRASALRAILSKSNMDEKELAFFDSAVGQFVRDPVMRKSAVLKECVCFVLGGASASGYTVDLIRRYYDARGSLDSGQGLPRETLEGIRATYHKETPKGKVLELAKTAMSEGDRMRVQKAAKEAGIEVEFDPTKQDIVSLFVYALEMGMTDAIREAIFKKAADIARSLPMSYNRVGIVLDASMSMFGSKEAKRRPLAIALAMREVLGRMSRDATYEKVAGGAEASGCLVYPQGDTSLAEALVEVVEKEPDAVFIITDGYENAPAGRVNEVVKAMRGFGVSTPMYQVTSVIDAGAGSVRSLSDEMIPMPVSRPAGIGLAMVRAALEADLPQGIKALIGLAKPVIEGKKGGQPHGSGDVPKGGSK